jgi:NADPH:quinone reductase-like Zn-dependent oxidoreductase
MALKERRQTTSMKAFILDRYGSADHVRAGDMPDPELREDDVLVQIHAAGSTVWIPKSETASSSGFFYARPADGRIGVHSRNKAKRRQAHYSFLFMRAKGGQLTEITSLIDDGIIRPVVDRVFQHQLSSFLST